MLTEKQLREWKRDLEENKKLQKAIVKADKDRQDAWRVIGAIEEILIVYNKRNKITNI